MQSSLIGTINPGKRVRLPGRKYCGLGVLLCFSAGCNSDGGTADQVAVRQTRTDSAGVEIIVNNPGSDGIPAAWTLSPDPLVEIGGSRENEGHTLHRVRGATLLRDGRIVIADGGSSELRFFDRTGNFLGAAGRDGDGPGEFRFLAVLRPYRGDSLFVWDARLRRGTVLDDNGVVGRAVLLERGYGSAIIYHAFADGSLLGVRQRAESDRSATLSAGELGHSFVRYSQTGDVIRTYEGLRALPCDSPDECQARTLFGYNDRYTTIGDSFVYGFNHAYRIAIYDRDGTLFRTIQVEQDLKRITDDEITRYIEKNFPPERQRPALEILGPAAKRTVVMPAFKKFISDSEGNIWVEEVGEVRADMLHFFQSPQNTSWLPTDERPRWSVLDTTGALIVRTSVPPGLVPLEIGDDYIIGVRVDESGREAVLLYRLSK
jgi:hypothetical protein